MPLDPNSIRERITIACTVQRAGERGIGQTRVVFVDTARSNLDFSETCRSAVYLFSVLLPQNVSHNRTAV